MALADLKDWAHKVDMAASEALLEASVVAAAAMAASLEAAALVEEALDMVASVDLAA